MIEIRIHGRGGQGAVVASEIIARAAFLEGRHVQAFPSFGSERRGAPVAAFVRLDESPIRVRTEVYEPDGLIVLDQSLITEGLVDVTKGLKRGGWALINSGREPEVFTRLAQFDVATVDASKIAVEHGLGSAASPIVNTAILGALASAVGIVSLDSVERAIRDGVPIKPDENAAAARAAADAVRVLAPAAAAE